MKVVFLGMNDWSNECNKIARAITRAGKPEELQARCVIQHSHPFQYPEDIVIDRGPADAGMASTVVSQADVLVTTGDGDYEGFTRLQKALGGSGKPVAAMHVGRQYRESPGTYDAEDKARGWRRRFVSPDLYRFCKDDPESRIYLIPHDEIVEAPVPYANKFVVVHTPSNRERKGSAQIETAAKNLEDVIANLDYRTIFNSPAEVSWTYMKRAHVLVDHLEPWHGGIGGAAQEGFSFGCVVMADWRNLCKEVERWVALPPGMDVWDHYDIERELVRLSLDPALLTRSQAASLSWAKNNLAPEAIFRYWKEHLCSL